MHSIKVSKRAWLQVAVLGALVALFLLTRLPLLSSDEINPDAVNWHYRSQQFINGLKYRQFDKTYQHYHPGVTLMWVTGVPVELYKQVSGIKVIDITNFQTFHLVSKLSIVFVQLALTLFISFLLTKLVGFARAIAVSTFFTFEPFFLGNSRLYHMDALFSLLLFAGLLCLFIAVQSRSRKHMFLAGVLFAFSFLTRSLGIGAIAFGSVCVLGHGLVTKSLKISAELCLILLATFAATTFLFFPALWVDPIYYLSEIFREGERIGVRNGHTQIIFGEATENAGLGFYLLVLLIKSTPTLLLGFVAFIISGLVSAFRNRRALLENLKRPVLALFLGAFYVGYVSVMSLPSKKIDRYMIVLYPFLALFAACSYYKLFARLRGPKKKLLAGLVTVVAVSLFYIFPIVQLFPYLFLYTSPILKNALAANKVIGQKPFGMGIFELRQYILNNYGEARLGLIDTKPIEAIYPNSKVFDIRVNGSNAYDLIVLGINEEMPEKALNGRYKFEQDASVMIGGLEYWGIYVKKPK